MCLFFSDSPGLWCIFLNVALGKKVWTPLVYSDRTRLKVPVYPLSMGKFAKSMCFLCEDRKKLLAAWGCSPGPQLRPHLFMKI